MEEGKKMWRVVYSPEDKTFEASTSFACQEAWDEAELIDNGWAVVVEAGNKADAIQLGYNMIRAAICRQEAALKDIAQPEFEKAKAEQEQGPKWWDVCYSVHTKQYSVREVLFTLTGPQKDGEIEDDKGCYRIYVQAPNKKMACVDADFRIGQYLLRLQTDMACAVRRIQREYFFNDGENNKALHDSSDNSKATKEKCENDDMILLNKWEIRGLVSDFTAVAAYVIMRANEKDADLASLYRCLMEDFNEKTEAFLSKNDFQEVEI